MKIHFRFDETNGVAARFPRREWRRFSLSGAGRIDLISRSHQCLKVKTNKTNNKKGIK
jgi:hypothetical protein